MDALEKKRVFDGMKDALVIASSYLINGFPIDNQIVHDSKYFHPKQQQSKGAPAAFRRLARSIITSLPVDTVRKEFNVENACVDSIIDIIASEFQSYQMEIILESFYTLPSQKPANGRVQCSYWKHAYGIAKVSQPENDTTYCFDRMDNYWEKVFFSVFVSF